MTYPIRDSSQNPERAVGGMFECFFHLVNWLERVFVPGKQVERAAHYLVELKSVLTCDPDYAAFLAHVRGNDLPLVPGLDHSQALALATGFGNALGGASPRAFDRRRRELVDQAFGEVMVETATLFPGLVKLLLNGHQPLWLAHVAAKARALERSKRRAGRGWGRLALLALVLVPVAYRSRYRQEWLAELFGLSGLAKARYGVGVFISSWGLRRSLLARRAGIPARER